VAHLAVTSGKTTASPLMAYVARRGCRRLGAARRQCLRPFRRPLSQMMGPAIRSSYLLVTVAAGCAAARCIPDLSTYADAPRMLTTPGCTALHVVPANAQELISVIFPFEDQLVSIQAPILSLTGGDSISPPRKPLSSLSLAKPILVSCPYVTITRSTCSPTNHSPFIFLPNGCGRC